IDRVGVRGLCGAAVRARAATGRARLMRGFFDLRQRAHAPAQDLHNGGFVAYAETPARADAILAALGPLERSGERRVGNECVRTGTTRWSQGPSHKKETTN